MAAKLDLQLDQGADNTVQITYAPGGLNFDLTGWTAALQARRNHADDTADISLSTATGEIVITGAMIAIEFSAVITAALDGRYVYDLVVTDGSAKRRIVEGAITINPAATR